MKKQIVSILIAAILIVSSVFVLAACQPNESTTADDVVTSVAFGSVDYKVNEEVAFEIVCNGIILFDATTKNRIAMGKLTLVK